MESNGLTPEQYEILFGDSPPPEVEVPKQRRHLRSQELSDIQDSATVDMRTPEPPKEATLTTIATRKPEPVDAQQRVDRWAPKQVRVQPRPSVERPMLELPSGQPPPVDIGKPEPLFLQPPAPAVPADPDVVANRPLWKKKRVLFPTGLFLAIAIGGALTAESPPTTQVASLQIESEAAEVQAAPAEVAEEEQQQVEPATSNEEDSGAVAFEERETFGVDYGLLSDNFRGDLTELQFEEFASDLIGTEVGWHGEVEEVQEELFNDGNFEIVVDVRGAGSRERARLSVPRAIALGVPADAEIFFTGTIQDIDNSFGLSVDLVDVTVEGSDGTIYEVVESNGSRTEPEVLATNDPNDFETWSINSAEMSEIQFEEWAAQFIGNEFTFTGQVEDVEELLFEEGFEALIDVDGGEGFFERARLRMTREQALTVPADSQITFTGTLSEVDNVFSLSMIFTDVTFTEA